MGETWSNKKSAGCPGNRYEDCLKEEAKGKLRRAAQRVEQKQREGGAARGPEAQGYR